MAGIALAVQIEEKAPHRVGRKPAVAEQVVPVVVTMLARILFEGLQEVACVLDGDADLG